MLKVFRKTCLNKKQRAGKEQGKRIIEKSKSRDRKMGTGINSQLFYFYLFSRFYFMHRFLDFYFFPPTFRVTCYNGMRKFIVVFELATRCHQHCQAAAAGCVYSDSVSKATP